MRQMSFSFRFVFVDWWNELDWLWCCCLCLCPQISMSVERVWLSATTSPAASTCPAGTTVNAEVVSMTMAPTCSMGAPALVSIHRIENILITAWNTGSSASACPPHSYYRPHHPSPHPTVSNYAGSLDAVPLWISLSLVCWVIASLFVILCFIYPLWFILQYVDISTDLQGG